jgi:acyl-coenzyme A thioesterase PaaI-like protein
MTRDSKSDGTRGKSSAGGEPGARWVVARQAWMNAEPGRLIGRGHPVGDFLEAYKWKVLEEEHGYIRLEVHLPKHVRNLRDQLFGGFTGTYVDFIALYTVRAGADRSKGWRHFLATTNMRIDYFEPVVGPHFIVESRVVKERGRMGFVETRFFDEKGHLTVFALLTLRKLPVP